MTLENKNKTTNPKIIYSWGKRSDEAGNGKHKRFMKMWTEDCFNYVIAHEPSMAP